MSDAGQPGWPNGVRPILVPDLKRLVINEQNGLFWDGRHVEIRRSLTLTRFQKFITIIVTFCAVLGALGGLSRDSTTHPYSYVPDLSRS